jgi:hypothetical protein
LAAAFLLSGGAALLGCPQLLEDRFDNEPALPETSLDSGGATQQFGPDASVDGIGSAGAPAAGGAANTAAGGGGAGGGGAGGAAGDGSSAGGSNAGTAGQSGALLDAGPDVQPASELGALLAHRYRFDDVGSTIADAFGTANGASVGATVSAGSGKISLSGFSQYVDLPNGLVSDLQSVTFEIWVNWRGNSTSSSGEWQGLFDFGSSGAEGAQSDTAHSRIYVTAKSSLSGRLRAGYTATDYNHEIAIDATRVLPASADPAVGTQVVLVVNGETHSLIVYIDGTREGAVSSASISLGSITDINNWLGRSQYAEDPEFEGDILDFRLYAAALSDEQVALSFGLGADASL